MELNTESPEDFCSRLSRIADLLQGIEGGFFIRSPDNPELTRAVVYNLFCEDCEAPRVVNPVQFAIKMLFAHRGLYGGPQAVLEGDREAFDKAFFGAPTSWPLSCGMDHTWHVIGPETLYPELSFKPSREECLMTDSELFGTIANTRQANVKTTVTDPRNGTDQKRNKVTTVEQAEVNTYVCRLPTGHHAIVRQQSDQSTAKSEYRVTAVVTAGTEGLGTKNWKAVREISIGRIFARILNENRRLIESVRDEAAEMSPIDFWVTRTEGAVDLPFQATSIEPNEFFRKLTLQDSAEFTLTRRELLDLVKSALSRKMNHSAQKIHLLLDCGYLVPLFDQFKEDVIQMSRELAIMHESVWLVSRANSAATMVAGQSPFGDDFA